MSISSVCMNRVCVSREEEEDEGVLGLVDFGLTSVCDCVCLMLKLVFSVVECVSTKEDKGY